MRVTRALRCVVGICLMVVSTSIICYNFYLLATKQETVCDLLMKAQPLDTTRIVNPHPYINTIVPHYVNCDGGIYLVVYVQTALLHHERRSAIRKSWGNVSQYGVLVRVVFVIGTTAEQHSGSRSALLQEEVRKYGDILESNFIDSYRNLSIKAVSGLKWVTTHCQSAKYILKTDDDTFVNMYLLLGLLEAETNAGQYGNNALVCNEYVTNVNRGGKWKITMEECSLKAYPPFCQGIAFVMSMDVAVALYNASYYVPPLWLDDVYITGFVRVLLPVNTVKLINAGTFYMTSSDINIETRFRVLLGPDAYKFIFYHLGDVSLNETTWSELSNVVRRHKFQSYLKTMFNKDTELRRDRLKLNNEW